jgi:hypothetical protein
MSTILNQLEKAREEFRRTGDPRSLALVADQNFEVLAELLERKPLDLVMGVEEASAVWDLSPGRIKNICAEGKVPAKKVGRTWIVSKLQPSPKQIAKRAAPRTLEELL